MEIYDKVWLPGEPVNIGKLGFMAAEDKRIYEKLYEKPRGLVFIKYLTEDCEVKNPGRIVQAGSDGEKMNISLKLSNNRFYKISFEWSNFFMSGGSEKHSARIGLFINGEQVSYCRITNIEPNSSTITNNISGSNKVWYILKTEEIKKNYRIMVIARSGSENSTFTLRKNACLTIQDLGATVRVETS